jgi:hypothetical protein
MSHYISKFNPQMMSEQDILSLSTGREKMLDITLNEMETCLDPKSNQHFVFYGPRGIGKTFFIRLLKIHHKNSSRFNSSIFIELPEEQSNIAYVADLLDMISNKIEGKNFDQLINRWECTPKDWKDAKKRFIDALANHEKKHVFVSMENLQDFIPKLDTIENGRMRELLSDFKQLTLIGTSLHPNLDNNYDKKLFQVFKKFDIQPWKIADYITYFRKKAELFSENNFTEKQSKIAETKFAAISHFAGGSPRLAVLLSNLILKQEILSTAELFNGVLDELTPYYQDLTKDIPARSKILFDTLIREGENINQSELAARLQPPQQQSTIARSFKWLTDNFYVISHPNAKSYFVRDRLYAIYYRNREIKADKNNAFIELFVDFLAQFFNFDELFLQMTKLDENHNLTKDLLKSYGEKMGLNIDAETNSKQIKETIKNEVEIIFIEKFFNLIEKKKDYNAAFNLLNKNEIFRLNEKAWFLLLIWSRDNDYYNDLSFEIAKVYVKIFPFNEDVNHYLGIRYLAIRDYSNALNCFLKVKHIDLSNLILFCYAHLNQFDQLAGFYKSLDLIYLEHLEYHIVSTVIGEMIQNNEYELCLIFLNKITETELSSIISINFMNVLNSHVAHSEKFQLLMSLFHKIIINYKSKEGKNEFISLILRILFDRNETELFHDFLSELTHIPEIYDNNKEFIDLFLMDKNTKILNPEKERALELFKDFFERNNFDLERLSKAIANIT